MHPILEELTGELARVRADLAKLIDATPAERFDHRPRNGGWTGAGIIQHPDTSTGSWLHSLDQFSVLDRSRRIEAPERAHPAPDAQLAPSWASLRSVRERLLRAVASVDGRDLTTVGAPHPVFGALNGYQWVLVVGKHEERHLSQLRATLSEA